MKPETTPLLGILPVVRSRPSNEYLNNSWCALAIVTAHSLILPICISPSNKCCKSAMEMEFILQV